MAAVAQDNGGMMRNEHNIEDDDPPRLCTRQIGSLLAVCSVKERCSGCTEKQSAGSGVEDVIAVHPISCIG